MSEGTKTAPSSAGLPKVKRAVSKPKEEVKKEIPVAARYKGPGPAAYSLPSTLGLRGPTKRAPAYSFGVRYDVEKVKDESPGPNAFFPRATRTGATKGPAFSLQGRFKKDRASSSQAPGVVGPYVPMIAVDTPGPARYNPPMLIKDSRAPAYSMGGRRPDEKLSENPGPAEYKITTTIGVHTTITLPAAAAYTIKPPRVPKVESSTPGPAAYQPLDPSKIKKCAPAYSLGGRWHNEIAESPFSGLKDNFEVHCAPSGTRVQGPTPGPGHYSPSTERVKQATPSFSFRTKHSEFEHFVPECESAPLVTLG